MSLLDLATAALRGGERRVEIASQNVVNADTPGFKAQIPFSEATADEASWEKHLARPAVNSAAHTEQGALIATDAPLDLAINGDAYFAVRAGDQFHLTRGGQFGISADGALIDAQGRILQRASGGDLTTTNFAIEILSDGTVLDDGVPIGAIGVFERSDDGANDAIDADQLGDLAQSDASEVHQKMLERSNVTLSDEMVELMKAQRQIEAGAQLIRAYDQLMDQAVTTFSRSGS